MTEQTDTRAIDRLTKRQREALRLYAANLSAKEIGALMGGLSENTVGGYLSDGARVLGTGRGPASAQLMAYEATHPDTRGRFSVGDPDQPAVVITVPAQEQPIAPDVHWTRYLPLRLGKGKPGDLTLTLRLAWTLALALLLAFTFAWFAVGIHFINDLVPRL